MFLQSSYLIQLKVITYMLTDTAGSLHIVAIIEQKRSLCLAVLQRARVLCCPELARRVVFTPGVTRQIWRINVRPRNGRKSRKLKTG